MRPHAQLRLAGLSASRLTPGPAPARCRDPRVSGAFYTTVSWLAKDLRTYRYALINTQGLLITSLVPNALGLLLVGMALDRGAPALWLNALLVLVGSAFGFCMFWGVGQSLSTAWGLVSLFHLVIGIDIEH